MKVSLKWLKDFIEITLPLEELAERLTMSGTEVSATQTLGGSWDNIYVGQVLAVDPHPNADRLKLATVSLGTEQQTVVCGAPNLTPGQKIAFGKVGARLTDPQTGKAVTLKPAKIRGVPSEGMVLSERELGISDDHTGILVLPPDAPIGQPLSDYLGDTVLDIDVTPNRADCFCHMGIAREIAALTQQTLRLPPAAYPEEGPPIQDFISVEIWDPDLCPRYTASLIQGIKIGPSPRWMQDRLLAAGQRPINNVVDITNYVMLELGQPLHSFDYDLIGGRKIIVRRAREGEVLTTLDGTDRPLSPDMLVIADADKAVAVAGVMGGASSEVAPSTTTILLEAANFDPTSLRRTATALKMRTEASLRFEKGLGADLAEAGLRRATRLIQELASGKVARGIADVYPGRKEPPVITLTPAEVARILGIQVSTEEIARILTSLGFVCTPGDMPEVLKVAVPYWRTDVRQPADLVEEVGRIIGYDQIPTAMLSGEIPHHQADPKATLVDMVRDILVGSGLQEIITYSLTSESALDKVSPSRRFSQSPVRLANPMSAEQSCLRTTLRAGLLATLAANQRHETGPIRLFEAGRVFLPRDNDLPDQRDMLGIAVAGPLQSAAGGWKGETEPLDFFDAKGIIENLFCQLGVAAAFEESHDDGLYPGRRAAIMVSGREMGVIGEVHPQVAEAFELRGTAYLVEVDLVGLLPYIEAAPAFHPLPRFPSTLRDLALVMDYQVPAARVQGIITAHPLVASAVLFDVFTGGKLPPGKKSLAYRITYRSPGHTLTDEEVNRAQQQILEQLSRDLGAILRA